MRGTHFVMSSTSCELLDVYSELLSELPDMWNQCEGMSSPGEPGTPEYLVIACACACAGQLQVLAAEVLCLAARLMTHVQASTSSSQQLQCSQAAADGPGGTPRELLEASDGEGAPMQGQKAAVRSNQASWAVVG